MDLNGKNILFLEPSSGISGDMFLSSLIDFGLEKDWLIETIGEVLPEDTGIDTWRDDRGGISGTRFKVRGTKDHVHRGLEEIKELIEKSSLVGGIKKQATNMFEKLAKVEAGIHGVDVDAVHFHEVGAIDSIADIVGVSAAMWKIDPRKVYSTPVNVGSGNVQTAHGELPVPAPATAELLKQAKAETFSDGANGELTTPTGALIISNFVDSFSRPAMIFRDIGYGLGSRQVEGRGNFLRVTLGSLHSDAQNRAGKHELVLETNIDDMNPELFPVVEEKLLKAGALDVFKTPVQMKKNRPGTKLSVICNRGREEELTEIIFRETTTLGIRVQKVDRKKLDREIKEVETEFGIVEIKIGYLRGEAVNYSPEFESCQRLADKTDVPVKLIYREALLRAEETFSE